jgi:multidrug efflux pump subunit AcrA (membrane-fusion protein)
MDVDNSNGKLLPGMVSEVNIPLDGQPNTFIVPKSAIVNSTVKPFVVRVVNNKAQWVNVEMGRSGNGKQEVFGNLSLHDTLVRAATEEIRDGSRLKTVFKQD